MNLMYALVSCSVLLVYCILQTTAATLSPSTASTVTIDCKGLDPDYFDFGDFRNSDHNNTIVQFKYNRSNLEIQKYPESTSVNLIIDDSNFYVLGKNENGEVQLRLKDSVPLKVIGSANVVDISGQTGSLEECQFFVLNEAINRTGNIVFYRAYEECLNQHFCQAFGAVHHKDFIEIK